MEVDPNADTIDFEPGEQLGENNTVARAKYVVAGSDTITFERTADELAELLEHLNKPEHFMCFVHEDGEVTHHVEAHGGRVETAIARKRLRRALEEFSDDTTLRVAFDEHSVLALSDGETHVVIAPVTPSAWEEYDEIRREKVEDGEVLRPGDPV